MAVEKCFQYCFLFCLFFCFLGTVVESTNNATIHPKLPATENNNTQNVTLAPSNSIENETLLKCEEEQRDLRDRQKICIASYFKSLINGNATQKPICQKKEDVLESFTKYLNHTCTTSSKTESYNITLPSNRLTTILDFVEKNLTDFYTNGGYDCTLKNKEVLRSCLRERTGRNNTQNFNIQVLKFTRTINGHINGEEVRECIINLLKKDNTSCSDTSIQFIAELSKIIQKIMESSATNNTVPDHDDQTQAPKKSHVGVIIAIAVFVVVVGAVVLYKLRRRRNKPPSLTDIHLDEITRISDDGAVNHKHNSSHI